MNTTRRLLWPLLAILLAACASSEGGVVGSGISAVTGNVVIVADSTGSSSQDGLPFALQVALDGAPNVVTTTDADGNFSLSGHFAGAITLRFADSRSGAELGRFALEVPVGSTTVLENIEIRPDDPAPTRVTPEVVKQFDAFGRIQTADCGPDGSGELLIVDESEAARTRQFLVRVLTDTEIARQDGEPLDCSDLVPGDRVAVDGVLRGDLTIAALQVVLAPQRGPAPDSQVRSVETRGQVSRTDCVGGLLLILDARIDPPFQQLVRIAPGADVQCLGALPTTCACTDIRVGDRIAVQGEIHVARPGRIDADVVRIETSPRHVELAGRVVQPHCAAAFVTVDDSNRPPRRFRVLLTGRTRISCDATSSSCQCGDIRPGDLATVTGTASIDRPQAIEAETLAIEAPPTGP